MYNMHILLETQVELELGITNYNKFTLATKLNNQIYGFIHEHNV